MEGVTLLPESNAARRRAFAGFRRQRLPPLAGELVGGRQLSQDIRSTLVSSNDEPERCSHRG